MPDPRPHLHPLTGIRALAALWVVAYHLRGALYGWFPELRALAPFFESGHLGVDLFFVLSGFIIAYNYLERFQTLRRRDWLRFLWLRLARIYPVHLFTIALLAALVLAAGQTGVALNRVDAYGTGSLLANLTLVHGWGLTEGLSWNRPSWSISAEWFAYLLFPCLAWAATRATRIGALPPILALLLAALAARILFGGTVFDLTGETSAGPLLRITTEFTAGVCLYRLYTATRAATAPWGLVTAVAVLLLVTTIHLGAPEGVIVLSFPLLIFALAHGGGLGGRFLATRPAVFGGRISYALYMTHAVVLLVFGKLLPPDRFVGSGLATRLGVVALYLATMIVAAALTWRFVEEPSRRYLRRQLDRRTAARVAAETA